MLLVRKTFVAILALVSIGAHSSFTTSIPPASPEATESAYDDYKEEQALASDEYYFNFSPEALLPSPDQESPYGNAIVTVIATAQPFNMPPIPSYNGQPYNYEDDLEIEFEPSPEPSLPIEGEECVDAQYVTRYGPDDLVHDPHILAQVLCPVNSSLPCGTPDHMLKIQGTPVSYRQFCDIVRCERTTMHVNSVLSHIWEDEEHDRGIVLTMLDVRHPERVQTIVHRTVAARRAVRRAIF